MASITTPPHSQHPRPAWEIAELFPNQGDLDDADYLIATEHTNRLAEFTDGYIEILPMPTTEHQRLVRYLLGLLLALTPARGEVLFAPLRVRLRRGKFREPDVVFMLAENRSRIRSDFWDRADLVMEVVSGDEKSRERDLITKRSEYAAAGISEYWTVDVSTNTITVLTLPAGATAYLVHGEFAAGTQATSVLLSGFAVDVTAVFDAAKG
jgi:Uma2 family endonuclease